jgi:hypothetical protein
MNLLDLYHLWDEFTDVPTNKDDEIEERFMMFAIGTHRETVWRWFETQNTAFIVGDVLKGIRIY